MTTRQLFWGLVLQGSAWGLVQGALLGAIYGSLIPIGMRIQGRDYFDVVYLITGVALGGLMGGSVGLILGAIEGLWIGMLMRGARRVYPSNPSWRSRIGVAIWVYGVVGGLIGFALNYLVNIEMALCYPNRCSLDWGNYLIFIMLPALIAGWVAMNIRQRITHWYESQPPRLYPS